MNILVITHEYPPIGGGGANACYYISKELAGRGNRVFVVTSSFRELPAVEEERELKIIRVPAMRKNREKSSLVEMFTFLFNAWRETRRIAERESIDICQIYFGIPSGPVGWYLKMKYGIPYVIRFGGGDIPGTQKRFGLMYKVLAPFLRIIWKNADALVANSDGLKKRAEQFESKYPIRVIPNGVDFNLYYGNQADTVLSTASEMPDKEIRLLFVSRLLERKGLQDIIPKLKEIEKGIGKKIKLVIVGEGPFRKKLEEISYSCHVDGIVAFQGMKEREELPVFYRNADIFILPSRWEGMPNVVLEAMAAGLPVVMTPCEGSAELIKDNGFIVDIQQFADKIIQLGRDNKLREKMGNKSMERARDCFQWGCIAEQYERLYREKAAKE